METKYLIALNRHPKIGGQTLKKMLAAYASPAALWADKVANLNHRLGEKFASYIIEARSKFNPDEEIDRLARYGVGYMTIFDKNYPGILKEVYDCPAILYIKGDAKVLGTPALGVVGSRKYSNYGKTNSYKLSKECAESGLTIISGLALGIDAFAHQATLDANGKTVGVLGCGLDNIYPVSNFHLGQEIIEKGGAIVSEFPIGVPPMKQNFPARNRIIAGLSLGVLVVEASVNSGSLITAMCALDYNRDVFAVPGNIDSESSLGANMLIQQGAKLVISSDDILSEINIEKKTDNEVAKKILPVTEDEVLIISVLSGGEKLLDELVEKTGLSIIAINTTLTYLEMKGLVRNIGGGRWKSQC